MYPDEGLNSWGEAASSAEIYVIMGLESHVCVQQTALDLMANGKIVFLAVDCITSQRALDQEIAFERLKQVHLVPPLLCFVRYPF